jgi:hypothetical protein
VIESPRKTDILEYNKNWEDGKFFSGSSSKGPKKPAPAPDYWLSLAKYSFPRKLLR